MKWMLAALLATSSLIAKEVEPIVHYQALFSPKDHLAEELISLIEREKKSIKVAVYCLTHRGIVKALTVAQARGVAIEVIVDPFSLRAKGGAKQLDKVSFPVFVWSPEPQFRQFKNGKKVKKKQALMHDKFCVFGEDRVWTGSFNFTMQATHTHQENALVVENKEIANSYLSEFERVKKSGCIPLSIYLADSQRK